MERNNIIELNNEGKTFPVEKIVMKTVLNTITLYYSILRVLEITILRIWFSIFVNGSMSRDPLNYTTAHTTAFVK